MKKRRRGGKSNSSTLNNTEWGIITFYKSSVRWKAKPINHLRGLAWLRKPKLKQSSHAAPDTEWGETSWKHCSLFHCQTSKHESYQFPDDLVRNNLWEKRKKNLLRSCLLNIEDLEFKYIIFK